MCEVRREVIHWWNTRSGFEDSESNREDRKSVWETYIVVDIVVVVDFQNFSAGCQGSNKVGIHVTLVVKVDC